MANIEPEPLQKKPRLDLEDDSPRELSVVELAQSHAKELRALTESIKTADNNRYVSQSVPHYMRRRATSHNINRLPRVIREKIIKSGTCPPAKKKKPSRYHRRRPKNLREAHQKRQLRVCWLETHLWHAKRFHMAEKWGHRLPVAPTDKSERAAFRAATKHCMIQDQSYYHCIQITADSKSAVIGKLKHLFPVDSLADDADLLAGFRMRSAVLYRPDSYPNGAVTSLDIMFNPRPDKEGTAQIWLWCHVAAHAHALQTLCCYLADIEVSGDKETPFTEIKSVDGSMTISSLADSLLTFTLCGPTSNEVLCRTLRPISPSRDASGGHVWWTGRYMNTDNEVTDRLNFLSKSISLDGEVLSVRVRDPRLCMPEIQHPDRSEKLKSWCTELQNQADSENAVVMRSVSPLWCESVRNIVSDNIMSQKEINTRRAQLLIPGSELDIGSDESCVPLLVIRHSSIGRTHIIIPRNWGMAFWMAFTYSGARPGGLRESRVIDLEQNRLQVPDDYPDTPVCRSEEFSAAISLTEKYHAYPPNKRPNHTKLAFNSPFLYDWQGLRSDNDTSIAVLRDKACLTELSNAAQSHSTSLNRCESQLASGGICYLVTVRIRVVNRGVPNERSEICLPTPEDLNSLIQNKSSSGPLQIVCKCGNVKRDTYHSVCGSDRLRPDREVIGYVKSGRYSHTAGSAVGVGFVTLDSLTRLLCDARGLDHRNEVGSGLVALFRANDSRQYRYALLDIVL